MSAAYILATLLACVVLWSFYEHESVCPLCGGRGKHRSKCPQGRDDDSHGLED
jgi:hypothetical protein